MKHWTGILQPLKQANVVKVSLKNKVMLLITTKPDCFSVNKTKEKSPLIPR